MATMLRRLKLKRVSLVDSPANLEARVVLFKSADFDKRQPTSSEVYVDEMVTCKSCGEKVKKADKCPKCGASMVSKEDVMDEKQLKADLDAANAKLEAATAQIAALTTEREALTKERDALQKAADTPEAIEKRKLDAMPQSVRERIEKAEAKVQALEAKEAEGVMVSVVKAEMPKLPGKAEDTGKLLKRVRDVVSSEDFDALTVMLKAASAQIEKAEPVLFGERGNSGAGADPTALSPLAQIEKFAVGSHGEGLEPQEAGSSRAGDQRPPGTLRRTQAPGDGRRQRGRGLREADQWLLNPLSYTTSRSSRLKI